MEDGVVLHNEEADTKKAVKLGANNRGKSLRIDAYEW